MVTIFNYNNETRLTPTPTYRVDSSSYPTMPTNSRYYSSSVYRSSDYDSKYQVKQREQKRKSKKLLQQERAELMRRQSLMILNEVKPKILKPIGYPYKSVPKVQHRNYYH